jgi:hypothetical protein
MKLPKGTLTPERWTAALRAIETEMRRTAEEEVRRRYREEHGLIYVKTYTVGAHFRPLRARRRRRHDA